MTEETQNPNLPEDVQVHLSRVIVPNFRVLKDIDITFDQDLVPRIFPLGSLNGGGKSTLLQLIFTLLHCCTNQNKEYFIENIIRGFASNQILAIIEIIVGNQTIELEFTSEDSTPGIPLIKPPRNPFIVCYYDDEASEKILLCNVSGLTCFSVVEVIEKISRSIFLAAPITQSFLFVGRETRELAFKSEGSVDYYRQVNGYTEKMTNFFTYDVVNLLIKMFMKARDDDFKLAISDGVYGNSYQRNLKDLETALGDKKVNLDLDFNGVSFFKEENGQMIKLYLEDLSHGELKRLSLFVWLKYNKIENSIVLIDEIEIALHPDWQYQIVRDLETWAPSNQYILATHSYELCHALTPAHVKEISPRLLKK